MPIKIEQSSVFPFVCSLVSILLGGAVLLGWYTHNESLVQVHSQFVPMQYNTALGFLVSGIGLVGLVFNRSHMVLVCGGLVAVLGAVTLKQYIFALDFGIDEFFMDAYIQVKTSHPGRMAPNTALCFLLTGVALIFLGLTKQKKLVVMGAELLGLTVLGLASMALLGYGLAIEKAYGWAGLTRMAVHTTWGFLVLGIGILGYAWAREKTEIASIPLWVPVALLTVIICMDLFTPLGVAAGVLYVPLVFCSLWFNRDYIPFIFAGVTSALIVAGYFATPHIAANSEVVILNRGLSVMAVWVTAIIVALQKRTQDKLSQSEAHKQLVLDNAGEGIYGLNMQGHTTFANKAAVQILGYPLEEMLNVSHHDLIHHSHADGTPYKKEECNLYAAFKDGRTHTEDSEVFWRKDGDAIPVEYTSAPIYDSCGDITGTVVIFRDISERKKAEEEVMTFVEALQHSNRELDDFAYIASHDLKEPLRGISNNALFLKEDCWDQFDEEGQRRLNRIEYLCKRLENLINDLLYFSRLGRQDMAIQSVDVNDIIHDIENTLETTLEENNAKIVIPESLPEITCDMPRVTEVFRNLITNAIKYNKRNERMVEIGTVPTHKFEQAKDARYVFYVKDNGIGIDKEFFGDIFRIFKRLNIEDKNVEGTGVGLTFVQKIIRRHGGEIWLESEPGSGTTFYFTLGESLKEDS